MSVIMGAERLSIAGAVDIGQERRLRERLSRAAGRAGAAGLVVDVSGVSFMDCARLGVLTAARRQVEAAGGRLVLAGPSPVVSRLLDLVALSEALPVVDEV